MPTPLTPPPYIGKTYRIATSLWRQIEKLRTVDDPCERRYLFTGPPGTGKTDVSEHLAAALTEEDYSRVHAKMAVNVESINGQSCTVDVVRRWTSTCIYRPLFGPCRVFIINEIDGMSPAALNEIRSWLDGIPSGNIVLASTNKPVEELQEQLQSRFKVCQFGKPQATEIKLWLMQEYSLSDSVAFDIATRTNGNVRAAKTDALHWKEINE